MAEFRLPPELSPQSAANAWRLFRILGEFVEGFETLSSIGPSISVFGSSRLPRSSPYYQMAYELSKKLVDKGFSIITGAGPSIMEAANKGAQSAKGNSCGLVIDLPFELEPNIFIDPKLRLRFRYFFVRKVMFMRYAQGIVFFPGGLGTFDELFEIVTLVQTKKTVPIPVYLVGTSFYKGLLQWLHDVVLQEKCISKQDLDLFILTDSIDEVANGLEQSYKDRLKLEENSMPK
jgi:uncharacterized protein (TIGR00730 family)